MEYAPPPPKLADRISSLYKLRQNVQEFDETERADRAQFRVIIHGQCHYHFADGRVDPGYPVTIIGPTSGTIRIRGTGPAYAVGAGLLPAAWGALMGAEADQMANRAIDATSIFGERSDALLRACSATDDTQRQFALICDFVADATDAAQEAAPYWFIRLVDAWLVEQANPAVETLVQRTGLGMRQVERLTKRYYGLPPKTLARKYRALRAASALACGEDLDELGLGETFYDQSHLIREMKRFAGLTPEQIRQQQSNIVTAVAQGRKTLTGKVSPLVSDA